jgi:hypothetical protein
MRRKLDGACPEARNIGIMTGISPEHDAMLKLGSNTGGLMASREAGPFAGGVISGTGEEHGLTSILDEEYPAGLRGIHQAPPVIFT